jgi:hypothetical protein
MDMELINQRRTPEPRYARAGSGIASGAHYLPPWYRRWYYRYVPSVEKLVEAMRRNQQNIAFSDLKKVCKHYFGEPRPGSGSHLAIYKMPWQGDPRVNIQDDNGKAKAYQVRQVLQAIDKKESM